MKDLSLKDEIQNMDPYRFHDRESVEELKYELEDGYKFAYRKVFGKKGITIIGHEMIKYKGITIKKSNAKNKTNK